MCVQGRVEALERQLAALHEELAATKAELADTKVCKREREPAPESSCALSNVSPPLSLLASRLGCGACGVGLRHRHTGFRLLLLQPSLAATALTEGLRTRGMLACHCLPACTGATARTLSPAWPTLQAEMVKAQLLADQMSERREQAQEVLAHTEANLQQASTALHRAALRRAQRRRTQHSDCAACYTGYNWLCAAPGGL